MRSIWAPGHLIMQAYSSFLRFISTCLWMQVWDCDWFVTLSRSHCRSSRRFGEPVQKRIKSMRIIDLNNMHKITKQLKRHVPRTDSARAGGRRLSAAHGWGQAHLMPNSSVGLLTGMGRIRLAPSSCFRRARRGGSTVPFLCSLPCNFQDPLNYRCFQPELKDNTCGAPSTL